MKNEKSQSVQYVSIDADFAGQRVDNFLITRLKGVPKTRIYRILRKGEVRVNKKRIEPSYRLQAGDSLRIPPIKMDEPSAPQTVGSNLMEFLKSRILFEDKSLLIINKPAGIPVHGGSRVKMGLVEIMKSMYPKVPHLELVHRLDLDTSGCLIFAKKRGVLKELHAMMREGRVNKHYWALTRGHWKPSELRVDVPLRKNIMQSGERIVRVDKEGKPSLTVFRVLEEFKEATLVEAALYTGRTHQIRVHSQYRQHPIAGDEKYGDREFNKTAKFWGVKRLFLHAYSIEFVLESTGQAIHITAPLDPELKAVLENKDI